MLIVLADDFSGAAEIGGIGHRYGLSTEIQLTPDLTSTSGLIVIDTATRAMSESDAILKISGLSTLLAKIPGIRLFKKIDSVMRGHLVQELNSLQSQFNFNRILVLPANPTRGRTIIGGKYFVNDVLLNDTVFAVDPDFPCTTADVARRIRSSPSVLAHVHADPEHIPSNGLITGDITSREDLGKYVAATDESDLCVGGAELFECFLEGFGRKAGLSPNRGPLKEFVLMVNGSTVKDQIEKEIFDRLQIRQFSVPGAFLNNVLTLNDSEVRDSLTQILEALQHHNSAVVSITHPIHPAKAVSDAFLNYFVGLMQYISEHMQMNDINFCLTGGATASAVIRSLSVGRINIQAEIAPGVVSLQGEKNKILFTVKPGSYPWPQAWLNELLSRRK